MVNYAEFFAALGFTNNYYDVQRTRFDQDAIAERIKEIQAAWRDKYPSMDFKTQNLRFDNLVNFNLTFTNEMEFLNMEAK